MPEIIKHDSVSSDPWQVIAGDAGTVPAGEYLIIPFRLWQQEQQALAGRKNIAVWLDSGELPLAEEAATLQQLPLIAINFPVFTDGRGFSIARLLRERFGYKGELRAIGYVLRDQLCFMKRCGFDSFVLPEGVDLQAALASLRDFTEYYQAAVDQPAPLFRRG